MQAGMTHNSAMDYAGNIGRTEGPHTWEEFLDLDDDDRRELIDGEFVEIETMPGPAHEYTVGALIYYVNAWAKPRRAGDLYASGYKVRVSNKRGIMPDLQYFAKDNPNRWQERAVSVGRPELAVEVISPGSSRYDRVKKFNWYADIGVPEYWIVHPLERTLQQFILKDGHYVVMASLSDSETFRPETFPGLEIPLVEIWQPRKEDLVDPVEGD
ncbi:Uma2 family endonuclease [Pendulispora brunnea]|uniref:Uma2 family endonuclease n=1 Tax=Pendulispora brunnea TaxID=2905690 RepID=A0ABZ2KBF2_9BACT